MRFLAIDTVATLLRIVQNTTVESFQLGSCCQLVTRHQSWYGMVYITPRL